jgi:acyl-CoA dehydrogenase
MNERASIGAAGDGGGFGFQRAFRLAQQVNVDGRPAIADRDVRARLADWWCQESGLRFTTYRSLSALSRGQTPGPENSISKYVSASKSQDLASFCMDLLGLHGVVPDPKLSPDAARLVGTYMSAPGMRVAGGTDEIMLNVIAERVLGLPQEPRVDKGIPFSQLPTGTRPAGGKR